MVFRHSKHTWTSVLAFKGTLHKYITTISVNKNGNLQISNNVNGSKNHLYNHKIELQKWHKIIIEQVSVYKKVNLFNFVKVQFEPISASVRV